MLYGQENAANAGYRRGRAKRFGQRCAIGVPSPAMWSADSIFGRRYGTDYFMRRIVSIIENEQWTAVGITGIRTPDDVQTLKQHFGNNFTLIYVHVNDTHTRYERARQRAEARDPSTFEEFSQKDREEEELFHIQATIQSADLTIDNSGSLEDFHREIEEKIIRGPLGSQLMCDPG